MFIGSDSQLVAPVRIGAGAYVARRLVDHERRAGRRARRRARAPGKQAGLGRQAPAREQLEGIVLNACAASSDTSEQKPLLPVLMEGLRRLEYRGYDSAGVAVVQDGQLHIRRSAGKLSQSRRGAREGSDRRASSASATRAGRRTAGRPKRTRIRIATASGRIVVVHNGIIENYLELKRELTAEGHTFVTETDTEIVAHLVEKESRGDGLAAAVRRALKRLRGLFALVLISADEPDTIVTVRNGPPVVIGLGKDEYFVASDIPAILSHTRDIVFLDDRRDRGRHAQRRRVHAISTAGSSTKTPQHVTWDPVMAEKAGYPHFMLKEIHEQPWAVRETVLGRTSAETGRVYLHEMGLDAAALARRSTAS